ncbi:hypothetical protein [Xanthobacter flavus]|uniref:hypothetical protein n=1 Tax=Xanthobacter flavus TaxID=281 RepID=UPI00372963C4
MPSLIPFSRSAAILTVAGFTMLSGIGEAAAWTRTGSTTTSRGTYNSSGAGGCAGGTCSRASTVTGPAGGTASHTGSVTRTSPGTYSYQGSSTGPAGNSVSRSGTVSRY